jgi:hypothetical protein
MTEAEDDPRLKASAYPLIAFIHAPKTAGTTVKQLLDLCSLRAHGSVHFVWDDRAALLNLARNCDWIAGHTPRDDLANGLIWIGRSVEYFSSIREPVAQLVSHLNFSFERYSRSNYYVEVNRDEQQIDADVRATDFTDPAAVTNLLLRHATRYLDAQSRYLLGVDFTEISDAEVVRRLATYTYVTTETDLPKLYRAFGFAQLPEGADAIRENVAKYYLHGQVFDSPQLRKLLAYHHRHDLRLYAAVRGTSWPAERRWPFRPAFLAHEVFTSENFDERTYLDCNPDIADAVRNGYVASGRDHFDRYGCAERRMVRRWVFPPTLITQQRPTEADFSASSMLDRLRKLREDRARVTAELQQRTMVGAVD